MSDVINAIIQSGVPFKCAFGGDETVAGRPPPEKNVIRVVQVRRARDANAD